MKVKSGSKEVKTLPSYTKTDAPIILSGWSACLPFSKFIIFYLFKMSVITLRNFYLQFLTKRKSESVSKIAEASRFPSVFLTNFSFIRLKVLDTFWQLQGSYVLPWNKNYQQKKLGTQKINRNFCSINKKS